MIKRYLLAAAFVLPLALLGSQVRADDKAPAKKSDVVVKVGTKAVKAKVGQRVELQLPNTPPPAAKDIKVTVDGDAIDKVTEKAAKVVKQGDKPISGQGEAKVILTAKAAGTSHVKIEYKAGDKDHTYEYDVEVTN